MTYRLGYHSEAAKNNSFEARIECVRVDPGKQSQQQKKSVPHNRTNHREDIFFCIVDVRARLIKGTLCSTKLLDMQPLVSKVEHKASTGTQAYTYAGTGPCKHGQMRAAIRHMISWQKRNLNLLFALCLFYLINKLMSTCTSMSMSTHVHGMTSRTRPIQTWLNETIDGYRLPRQFIFKFRPIH